MKNEDSVLNIEGSSVESERYRLLFENSRDGIVIVDSQGHFIDANNAYCNMLGYTLTELRKMKDYYAITPEKWWDWERNEIWHNRLLKDGTSCVYEKEYIRKNGEVFPVELNSFAVFKKDGSPDILIGIVRDITYRKNAEEALLRSRALLKTILDGIEGIVYVANMKTYEILYINKYTRNLFGDVNGKICWQTFQAGQTGPCSFCTNDKLLTAEGTPGEPYRWEFENTANGRWYDIRDRAVEWEPGRFVRMEIATDITERKHSEKERERLIQEIEEKKSELEEIIRATSHDLRAPLVNVMGYHKEIGYSLGELETALSELTIPEDAKEKISCIIEKDIPGSAKYIETSVAKMDSLLSGLLNLSRSGRADLKMEALDMGRLVKEVISTFEHQFKEKGARHEESEMPSCFGDEKLMNQVFSNLIGNALKYLDPERPGVIKISGYKEDGRVVYCVEDNGIGIPPEEQNKIFEIFHQVNAKSGGEGLGLNIVKKIVQRHNGKVWVESEFGRGSRFCVSFPATK